MKPACQALGTNMNKLLSRSNGQKYRRHTQINSED